MSPLRGVTVTGRVKDRGDGSYGVGVVWDAPGTLVPGVLVHQPERDPVPMAPPATTVPEAGDRECTEAAGKLLDCLGLHDPNVKSVRVKSVCVEVDLKDSKRGEDPDC